MVGVSEPPLKNMTRFLALVLLLAVACWPALGVQAQTPSGAAWALEGSKRIVVVTRGQQELVIGTVRFEPAGTGTARFRVTIDHAPFRDHFLSMREFKCLEGGPELTCHVPYPHAQPGTVGTQGKAGDLAWLEHQLMFFFKQPNEFGANLWNGLYFKLEATPRGLVGKPQAVDLNRISAPPAKADVPPFGPAQRDDMPAGKRWIEQLRVE
jgi:hypothetical protein